MHTLSHLARRDYDVDTPLFKNIRILLIEDCKSDVFLLTRMLEEASTHVTYEIIDVPRLIDAFSQIDQQHFDLVLLDLNLLDIDGVASVAALKAEAPSLPILVYSGSDDMKTKEKAMMCGATHYMVKGRESSYGLKHVIDQAVRH